MLVVASKDWLDEAASVLELAAFSEVPISFEVKALEERLLAVSEVRSLGAEALDVGSSEVVASDVVESSLV